MELPWRLFAAIVGLFLLIGLLPLLFWRELHSAAEFADVFGFVNALFAALAFGGVIWAIRLQTKELELQRLEIEETRDELRRSADAQTLSQQMHFLSALLSAHNSVAEGYAVAAERETGPLRVNQAAHRQQLAELEWLLDQVDRHPGNPFALPQPHAVVAHQLGMLVIRAQPLLQSALANRASNHSRSLLLDLNQSFRELRRLLAGESPPSELSRVLDECIAHADTVSNANELDEIASICRSVIERLSCHLATELQFPLPAFCSPPTLKSTAAPSDNGGPTTRER